MAFFWVRVYPWHLLAVLGIAPVARASWWSSVGLTVKGFRKSLGISRYVLSQQNAATTISVRADVSGAGDLSVQPLSFSGCIVTKTIPNYLRLHGHHVPADPSIPQEKTPLESFWQSYSDVTGWRVDQKSIKEGEVAILPAVNLHTSEMSSEVSVGKLAATRLAESANALAQEMQVNRERMRLQEMELAARAPILGGEAEQKKLSVQISGSLERAVKGSGCQAAAIYLLDEETQQLNCRMTHGLPENRIEQPPRSLRGSRGDLQAMVDGVVAIDDLHAQDAETWSSPEAGYQAAICTTIESDGVPVGTLWIYSQTKRNFSVAETTVAELSASEIGDRLRRASSEKQQISELRHEPAQDLAQWQYESLPVGSLVASGWRVDGLLESPRPWATGWHLWDILPDGTLMIVLAEAIEDSGQRHDSRIGKSCVTSGISPPISCSESVIRSGNPVRPNNCCLSFMQGSIHSMARAKSL